MYVVDAMSIVERHIHHSSWRDDNSERTRSRGPSAVNKAAQAGLSFESLILVVNQKSAEN
jgi:hypothetical protein